MIAVIEKAPPAVKAALVALELALLPLTAYLLAGAVLHGCR